MLLTGSMVIFRSSRRHHDAIFANWITVRHDISRERFPAFCFPKNVKYPLESHLSQIRVQRRAKQSAWCPDEFCLKSFSVGWEEEHYPVAISRMPPILRHSQLLSPRVVFALYRWIPPSPHQNPPPLSDCRGEPEGEGFTIANLLICNEGMKVVNLTSTRSRSS